MGVNAWLMKGFFDTIPTELDESAAVDGATPAQVFWGVVLPLAAPVLAVVALISFISTLNEFVIAERDPADDAQFTLPVGLQQLHRPAVRPALGAVRRRRADGGDPGRAALPVPAALHRRRADPGRGQGMSAAESTRSASLLDEPHHDGSDAVRPRAAGRARRRGRRPRCACPARRGRRGRAALRRATASRAVSRRRSTRRRRPTSGGARRSRSRTRARYRWLLSGGDVGYAWVNGLGVVRARRPGR